MQHDLTKIIVVSLHLAEASEFANFQHNSCNMCTHGLPMYMLTLGVHVRQTVLPV